MMPWPKSWWNDAHQLYPLFCSFFSCLYFFSYIFATFCNCAMNRKAVSGEVADSSIELQVFLPSGRCETVAISQSGTAADLKIAAQQSFGQRFLRLATADGCLLDPTESLRLSGLQNGVSLAAVAQQPKIAATRHAFALWCVGGDRIVTWGHPRHGGDSSRVQHQLTNVQQICGSGHAFAAILADWQMGQWWPGAIQIVVVTAPESNISWQMFSRSVAQTLLLLRFWQMERSWPGAIQTVVVTAPESEISWGTCSRSVAQTLLLLRFWQMERSLPGAIHTMVVTAPESKISSRMCSRFVAHPLLLLPFWQIEAWWHGAVQTMVVTALESRVSWGMFGRFVPHAALSLPFWLMEASWHGAIHAMVVTAPNISWQMFSRFVALAMLLLRFWQMGPWWPGAIHTMVVTAPESNISWQMFSRFVALAMLLLRFWQMGPWWPGAPGAIQILVVTAPAPESNISWQMFSRFLALAMLLLRFWQMGPWWPGAIQTVVVTAPECTICSRTFKRFLGQEKVALADLHLFLVIFSVTSLMVVNESWNCRAVSAKVRSELIFQYFPRVPWSS